MTFAYAYCPIIILPFKSSIAPVLFIYPTLLLSIEQLYLSFALYPKKLNNVHDLKIHLYTQAKCLFQLHFILYDQYFLTNGFIKKWFSVFCREY